MSSSFRSRPPQQQQQRAAPSGFKATRTTTMPAATEVPKQPIGSGAVGGAYPTDALFMGGASTLETGSKLQWSALTASLKAQWAQANELMLNEHNEKEEPGQQQTLSAESLRNSEICHVLQLVLDGLLDTRSGQRDNGVVVDLLEGEDPVIDQLFPLIAALALAPLPSAASQTLASKALSAATAMMLSNSSAIVTNTKPTATMNDGAGILTPSVRCAKLFEHHHVLQGVAVAIEATPTPEVAISLSETVLIAILCSDDIRRQLLFSDTVGDYSRLIQRTTPATSPSRGRSPTDEEEPPLLIATEPSQIVLLNIVAVFQALANVRPLEDSSMILVAHNVHEVLVGMVQTYCRAGGSLSYSDPVANTSIASDGVVASSSTANQESNAAGQHATVVGTSLHILAKMTSNCYEAFSIEDPSLQQSFAHTISILLQSRWSEVVEGASQWLTALCARCSQNRASVVTSPTADTSKNSSVDNDDHPVGGGYHAFFQYLILRGEAHLALVAAVSVPCTRVAAAAAHALRVLALHCPSSLFVGGKILADPRLIHVLCSCLIDASLALNSSNGTKSADGEVDAEGDRIFRAELSAAVAVFLAQSDSNRRVLRRHLLRVLSPASLNILQSAMVEHGLQEFHVSVFKSFKIVDASGIDLAAWARQREGEYQAQQAQQAKLAATNRGSSFSTPAKHGTSAGTSSSIVVDNKLIASLLVEQARWEAAASKSNPMAAPMIIKQQYLEESASGGAWQTAEFVKTLLVHVVTATVSSTSTGDDAQQQRRSGSSSGRSSSQSRGGHAQRNGGVSTTADSTVRRQLHAGEIINKGLLLVMELAHHAPQLVPPSQGQENERSASMASNVEASPPRNFGNESKKLEKLSARERLSSRLAPVKKEANPYRMVQQKPFVRRSNADHQAAGSTATTAKRWSVKDLDRGDLFLLHVSIISLQQSAAQAAASSAADVKSTSHATSGASAVVPLIHAALSGAMSDLKHHMEHINTQLQLCSVQKRQRRLVLLDLWTNVLPEVYLMLERLAELTAPEQGPRAIACAKLVIQILRDRGEDALDCGNLMEVYHAARHTFSVGGQ